VTIFVLYFITNQALCVYIMITVYIYDMSVVSGCILA